MGARKRTIEDAESRPGLKLGAAFAIIAQSCGSDAEQAGAWAGVQRVGGATHRPTPRRRPRGRRGLDGHKKQHQRLDGGDSCAERAETAKPG